MNANAEEPVEFTPASRTRVVTGGLNELSQVIAGNNRSSVIVFRQERFRRVTYRVLFPWDQLELALLVNQRARFWWRIRGLPAAAIEQLEAESHGQLDDVTELLVPGSGVAVVLQDDSVIGVLRSESLPDVQWGERGVWRPSRRRRQVEQRWVDAITGPTEAWFDEPQQSSTGEPVIRRTPHLGAPQSTPTSPGSVFSVTVWADAVPMAEEEDGADVMITAPASVRSVTVQVELHTSPHFQVVKEHQADLVINRDDELSGPVTFTIQVADNAPARPAGILALFKYRGRPCGYVSKAWDFRPGTPEAGPLPGHAVAAAGLPIHVDSVCPDVTVTITAPIADGQHFVCSVESPRVPGYQTPKEQAFGLPESAQTFVAGEIAGLVDGRLSPKARRRNLRTVGYRMWEAAPPNFQKLIWEIFDSGVRVNSLYIATAEPTLPWELMIPHRNVGGVFEEKRPLGIEFAIGRWTRGDASAPPQRLPIRNSFVISPKYVPRRRLARAADEVRFVEEHLRGTAVPEASIDGLDAYFAENVASLLHFVCHGARDGTTAGNDNDVAIYLDDEEELKSGTVLALDGFKSLCRRKAPVVFLNACEAGLTIPALVGSAGFPAAFSDIGARAILAPLWPVDDTLAHRYAMTIYEESITGQRPLAEVVRSARQAAYDNEESDTYAAFAYFGDPLATIQLIE